MKFTFYTDFLRNAQWLKPLQMEHSKDIVLSSFDQKFVGFGSCFAQNLKSIIQPFHLSFWFNREICAHYVTNTLLQTLKRASGAEPHQDDEFYQVDGNQNDIVLVNYWKLRFFGPSALANAHEARENLDRELLQKVVEGDIFIITLGNSIIFKSNKLTTIPCNLYSLTIDDFFVYQQTPEDVERDLNEIHSILLRIRSGRPFTMFISISPQRYIYDPKHLDIGCSALENNCHSKSVLRVAVNSFVKSKASEGVRYFPAYEMVVDELRLYETLSTYDHMHINQDFTPRYVVKKFLNRHASDAFLGVLPLIEGLSELLEETNLDLSRGATGTNPFIVEPWVEYFNRLVIASREIFPRQLWDFALDCAGKLGIAEHLRNAFADEHLTGDVKTVVSAFYQLNDKRAFLQEHLFAPLIQDFVKLVAETNQHLGQGGLIADAHIIKVWREFFGRLVDASQELFHNELWNNALDCAGKLGIADQLGEVFSSKNLSAEVKAVLSKFYSSSNLA